MKKIYILCITLVSTFAVNAQVSFGHIQNQIPRSQKGINQFDVKKDTVAYKGLSVDMGAAFALQFQALNSFNDQKNLATAPGYRLNNLENNFNLPNANYTIGAQLYDGVRVNLDVYLASRHHNETWVKGGYLQIDKLDFIKKDFLADFMQYTTIKIGQMENNYGDAHFRRSDNGNAFMNPFVGNNIMDAFITEMGAEVYYNRSGFVSMIGVTNSKLNQNVQEIVAANPTAAKPDNNTTISPSILAKLGWDKQINDDLRIRLTGSYYHTANSSGNLYSSDRAGSRFYGVMSHSEYNIIDPATGTPIITVPNNFDPTANKDTGRFNPGYGNWATSYMVNPFIKYKGLEFFGTLEFTSGGDYKGTDETRKVNQYVGDLVYRFGENERFYVGGKFNLVDGKLANANAEAIQINRFEAAAGWFMTRNVLAKLEYVDQNYKNFSQFNGATPNDLFGGSFKGLMFEAVISF
ncbi:hypothetical protein SAMN05444671_4793 [Flavobacterium sp. CF108]|uniref:hypothetical protein n=1 Tax=unclassified Flavobacterium TaxID=196869 RepID=UPI0008CF0121|nr:MULTISPECIES: hypothetical protein [unclassified Flavobacterium]SEP25258.1 hypothetical protein SAMN04487978_0281 [Flavobacterium sp. fv08]SHI02372.1 hypothetical protein SAMN05444671_4793 [Flavobacterium sp. CF108]